MARRLVALTVLLVFLLVPTASYAADTGATTQRASAPTATTPSAEPSPSDGASPSEGASESAAPAPLPEGPFLRITVFDRESADRTPLEGVELTATDADGQEVGQATTDAEGAAIIEIPQGGTYEVELDEASLPEGIELTDDTRNPVTVRALLNGPNGAQFPIGTQAAVASSFGFELAAALVSGLKFSLITALAALGLSLIFGTTGLTNFSHGELITLGGIMTWVVNVGFGLPVIPAAVVAVAVAAGFGWLQDRVLWRPLRRRGTGLIAMMIVSIGFALFLRYLFQYFFSPQTRSLSQYTTQARQQYGPIAIADKEIWIIGVALVVIAITCLALMKTRLGKAMRAVSDNPPLAASSGMRVDGVVAAAWILGTALSGLAGALLAVNSQVNFLMGFKLLLLVFAAVTLGGLGTIWGALLGSLVIGFMVEIGPLFGVPSSIKEVGALVVLILVLLVRPQGILGRRQRIG